MQEIELTIQPDGKFLISRGDSHHNDLICQIFEDCTDISILQSFFSISDDSELIFGEDRLCG